MAGHPTLLAVAEALLAARAALGEQLGKLEKRLVSLARDDTRVRRLMSTPGVGVLVALTYVAAIDDPGTVPIVEGGGGTFWPDAKEISVRRDGRDRADLEDRRRQCAHGAL